MAKPILSRDHFVPTATQINSWQRAGEMANRLPGRGGLSLGPDRDPALVIVRNTTGTTVPLYSVLTVKKPSITSASDADRYRTLMQFDGERVAEDDEQRFAITQTRVANNDIDPLAVAAGVTWVRLVGDTGKRFATTKANTYTLEAADSGPCIILDDPGPSGSERVARVKIGSSGGGACSEVDCLTLFGPITAGTVALTYVVDGTSGTITLQWDTDATDAKTAFLTHSKILTNDVQVLGGPWPSISLHVVWGGQYKGETINWPTVVPSLTGGGVFQMWKSSSADWKGYA